MPTALELFKQSAAWDPRYDLPTCPVFNNPWIYMAYAELVMRQYDGSTIYPNIWLHFARCESAVPKDRQTEGLFMRWPNGAGGLTSYDEILGAAYFSPGIARLIQGYLEKNGGIFNNTGEDKPDETMDIYRFIFMRPYLLACSGFRVSLWDQFWVALDLLMDSFAFASNGGKLKNYLLIYRMQKSWLVQLVGIFWRWQMKRHGCTLKSCLTLEPGNQYSIFGALAKEYWPL